MSRQDVEIHSTHKMHINICYTCGANIGTPQRLAAECGSMLYEPDANPRWSAPARSGTPGLGQPIEPVFPPARLGTRGRS